MSGFVLDNTLFERYHLRAQEAGLSQDELFPVMKNSEFEAGLYISHRLMAYLKRNLKTIMRDAGNSSLTFLLIGYNGEVQEIYGSNTSFIDKLAASGIKRRSIFDEKLHGPNAITIGLKEKKPFFSVGTANFSHALQDYAIYFSPVVIRSIRENGNMVKFGGLAAFLPAERCCADYLTTVTAITHDLVMTLHLNQMCIKMQKQADKALLFVDCLISKEGPTITYCDDKLLGIFGIDKSPDSYAFKPLDALIDPLPKNSEFWQLVNTLSEFPAHGMTISVQGQSREYIISGTSYDQPGVPMHGMTMYFTTPEKVSADISKRISNTATRSFSNIIGASKGMQAAVQRGEMLARTDNNILLLGESGVGKDVFAQAIHNASRRSDKPFVIVNCGALPRDLIASELFGYESGAFTGAKRQGNLGKFELANGGTIFLDEIGELPLDLQATLLRAVEQKQFMRLGSNKTINVDVKIISATNADLPSLISRNLFRTDLYYRLSTMRITIPPLRDRGDDIILLSEHFIRSISKKINRHDEMILSDEAKMLLREIPWYGNVRELQNLMECIVQLYPEPVIKPEHILENINITESARMNGYRDAGVESAAVEHRSQLTREQILEALEACEGNRSEAARRLGVARKTLYRNMERLGM